MVLSFLCGKCEKERYIRLHIEDGTGLFPTVKTHKEDGMKVKDIFWASVVKGR